MSAQRGGGDVELRRDALTREQLRVEAALKDAVRDNHRLSIVKAPPGSGKTTLLLALVAEGHSARRRIAVAAQTNSQADDICRRLTVEHPTIRVCRFISADSPVPDLDRTIRVVRSSGELPTDRTVVVGTTAKWGLTDVPQPYDILLVDEAWQMAWSDFMPLGTVAGRFVLIGDPGQIPPVVTVDTGRFETSARPPHFPAPEVILRDAELRAGALVESLPATRRLPSESLAYVREFYDFSFDAWAEPGARKLTVGRPPAGPLGAALRHVEIGTLSALTIPTGSSGPPLERDEPLARVVARVVQAALADGVRVVRDGASRPLAPADIGVSATHRVMNNAIYLALPAALRRDVMVDTPERWQGLERALMIAVHPLSGTIHPSEFDLETGRLCVMMSRHHAGLVIVSRDHIAETLARTVPSATQPIGRPDVSGRGHHIHTEIWGRLERAGLIAASNGLEA